MSDTKIMARSAYTGSKMWSPATQESALEAWRWLKRNGGGTVLIPGMPPTPIAEYCPVGSDYQIYMAMGGHPANCSWWWRDREWYPDGSKT